MSSAKETENYFQRSSNLISKLTILGVDNQLLKSKLSYRVLPDNYFACKIGSGSGEQFDVFRQICKWLFVKANQKNCAVAISNLQDPFAFSQKLEEQLAILNIQFGEDISLYKIKSGFGHEVLSVLESLAKHCLEKFLFKKPNFQKEEEEEEGRNTEEEIEEEEGIEEAIEDAKEEELINMMKSHIRNVPENIKSEVTHERGFLETKIDKKEWEREVQRVSYLLKEESSTFETQWRMHVDLIKKYSNNLNESTDKVNKLTQETVRTTETV